MRYIARHLWLSLIVFFPLTTQGQNLTVSPDGSIRTIRQAIEQAKPGDTICIEAGLYLEHGLVVDKPLTICGHDYPIIDSEEQGEIFTVIADHVTIEGLQLQNVGTSYLKDHAGIRVKQKKHYVIQRNKLVNTFFGIYLERASDGVIRENEIIGEAADEASSGNAIHAWYCKRLLVEDNILKQHRDGIYFEFVEESKILRNWSEDNIRYGLHFMFSNDDTYVHNTFRRNGAGVAVMFSKNIDMMENRFEYNWGRASYGLLLKEIYDAEIYDNEFLQNTIAINIESSTRIKYHHNNFRNNGWAIKMAGGCLDNVITANSFSSNTLDVVINSAVNNNTFNGNYWSEYAGYDLDRDGIGDVPHRPVKLFSYIIDRTPEAMFLLRSFFIDLINFSEKVSPVFTPTDVLDNTPLMRPVEKLIDEKDQLTELN